MPVCSLPLQGEGWGGVNQLRSSIKKVSFFEKDYFSAIAVEITTITTLSGEPWFA